MEQEAFAAVEEAEAEEEVPHEGELGNDTDVPEEGRPGAADRSFFYEDLSPQGAVAIHVFDVALDGGVGVVDEVVVERFELAIEGDGLVDGAVAEAGGRREVGGVAAEEAQLGVGIVAAAANPAAEEEIAAAQQVGVDGGVGGEQRTNLGLKFGRQLFVGVEREDPRAGALFDGGVLLRGEALPWFGEELDVGEGARRSRGCGRWSRSRRR